jgi:hypothetical protein
MDRTIVRSAGDHPVVGPKDVFDQFSSRVFARTSPGPAASAYASFSIVNAHPCTSKPSLNAAYTKNR